ncbi:alanine--tRNA ligase [Candidatus Nomurabacteria bacterium]|uniref:alanine--tRNA ligase n=1 Tax=candidate division WWE3 bacterium TaxID=2053526 RepID=A0A955E0T5_UNCKA|nr:alanine--tRNA ligase [candidate division WWE3 bacterium]MCB9823523.1 alanine--tRNA ligase [Candidatus Nomurabacteria bacterium]MCB9827318.1 alanine--tRNA ligase [Candidatus Nomurabacteria bacterium]HXK52410.1 alanine--tRNA ligase [bacterium]
MTSKEILEKYIQFYKDRGHELIPNVSIVPENDPTLLYVNSGMFPLVPYLSGQSHPMGKRLTNVQRCLRFFEDIENIGHTNRHTTLFHMVGNWSLGDYFKQEQLPWAYEFLIEVLGLDPNKIYATVFKGDEDAPKDTEAVEILKRIFEKYGIEAKEDERIFAYGKKDNWWQRGEAVGELGGPDSEIFYYIGREGTGFGLSPHENEDEFLEIGNSVFMQYKKAEDSWVELPQKNVDFGGGLERLALVAQEKNDIFETDNFWPIISELERITGKPYKLDNNTTIAMRKIADHMRAATILMMDGVLPSNKDQGYILRRLIRLMVRAGRFLDIDQDISSKLLSPTINMLSWIYPELPKIEGEALKILRDEETKFRKTLHKGSKEAEKELSGIGGTTTTQHLAEISFALYQSVGYPQEIFIEDAKEKGVNLDQKDFEEEFKRIQQEHQALSRVGAEKKFKGGLAEHTEQITKYHTATHLLHWALRQTLGPQITQQGSNITNERLRFDFSHNQKLSEKELKAVEELVNKKIEEAIKVQYEIMPKETAQKTGALHFFGEKYGDMVKVYFIGDSLESAFSREFCGGPHVQNTKEIGRIEIYKQEKIGGDKIRIYAK